MSGVSIAAAVVVGLLLGLVLKSRDTRKERPQARARLGEEPGIEEYLAQGRKIQAIKLYREQHGVSLKDAKEAIDRMTE